MPRLAAYNNIEVRALVRVAEKAASLEESGADLALGTFEDPQAIRAAVDGVDTLVLITLQIPMQVDRERSSPENDFPVLDESSTLMLMLWAASIRARRA